MSKWSIKKPDNFISTLDVAVFKGGTRLSQYKAIEHRFCESQ